MNLSAERCEATEAVEPSKELPLAGMVVLDLTRALSGPFCTMILGDLGAEVIKVEPDPQGDMSRQWGPFKQDESLYYLSANRNKKSININFRSDQGKNQLRKLVKKCNVLVENFKPGTLKEIGLNPDELRAAQPDLIIASINGFGSVGPLRDRPGFDQIAQGYSGFMSFTGTQDTGPTRVGVAIGDLTSGLWLAIGVLASWIKRRETGSGGTVETSLLTSLISLLSVQGQRYLSLGEIAVPSGNVHPVIAPYGVFKAMDGDLNIGAATQEMWLSLCGIINRNDLAFESDFLDNKSRFQNRENLKTIIENELTLETRAYWTEKFVSAGIPAGPINTIEDALEDEHVRQLGIVEQIGHPTLGVVEMIGNPLVLNGKPARTRHPPPLLGEHTSEILEILDGPKAIRN